MGRPLGPVGISLVCALGASSAAAVSFTYEGHLAARGQPANGAYDLQLTPFPAEKTGTSLAASMVFERLQVSDGRFRGEFDLPLAGTEQTWVELGVRDAGSGAFSRIPARTKVIAPPLIGQF